MFEKLLLNSWVSMSDGCPMRGSVNGANSTSFVFGGSPNDFEFTFDAEALRCFVTMATQALQEMDHRHALHEAGEPVPDEPTELVGTEQPEQPEQ
jgi:hypothetical protein